jgi:hypothetical protein
LATEIIKDSFGGRSFIVCGIATNDEVICKKETMYRGAPGAKEIPWSCDAFIPSCNLIESSLIAITKR